MGNVIGIAVPRNDSLVRLDPLQHVHVAWERVDLVSGLLDEVIHVLLEMLRLVWRWY